MAMGSLDHITAVIPAAGRVPDGVLSLSNLSSPAMIPIAGRPLVQWTMSYLLGLGIERFLIAVRERGLFVEDFVETVFGADCTVDFVVPRADRGLGFTIHELAACVETPASLVVLGDTHFEFADPAVLCDPHPLVLVDEVDESYRWCIAESGDDGVVNKLRDKEPGLTGPLEALIGVYYFPRHEVLAAAAASVTDGTEPGAPVPFTSILEEVAATDPLRSARAGMWLDCGNPDRQASSQRVLLEQRAFNELSVDTTFGTITKRSQHREKFIDEINYLRLLPNELAVLFPRVVDFSVDWDDPFVTMEFYGYPTLTELFVFENIDPSIWRRMLEHLFHVITDGFAAHERPLPVGATHEMLLGKAIRRLDALEPTDPLVQILRAREPVVVNGRPLRSLALLGVELEAEVNRLHETATGSVIHGDLCFSNVLFDLRSGICKLIDPRGSYCGAGIFGDLRYDVAKLYHSVHGLYDFITADLFRVEAVDGQWSLDIRSRGYHGEIRAAFDEVFLSHFDRREILLITGLIFVGLPALHYDHPNRQLAFALRGLQLIDEALSLPPSPATPVS